MDFAFVLEFIFAAAVTFAVLFITGPMLYTFWFDQLRDQIPNTAFGARMIFVGDLMFSEYKILGFLIPGVIIAWGFASAARKGVQVEQYDYEA